MDYEARIAKAEAIMESNRHDIDRLYQAISELRKLIMERADHLQAELVAQRRHIDGSLTELNRRMDEVFKEVRRDASINLRWVLGVSLMNTSMILAMAGRMFGLY